jgi:hypothetical protein
MCGCDCILLESSKEVTISSDTLTTSSVWNGKVIRTSTFFLPKTGARAKYPHWIGGWDGLRDSGDVLEKKKCCLKSAHITYTIHYPSSHTPNVTLFLLLLLFFSFGVLRLMLLEEPQPYGLLYYPILDFPTFSTSSVLPCPLSRESWSCNPVI